MPNDREYAEIIHQAEIAAAKHVADQYDPLTGLKKIDYEKDRKDFIKYIIMD